MWNEKFNREDYLYGTEPNDFLRVASFVLNDDSRILCIAEGEGRNACFLAMQGHQVTAMDASDVGLAKAEQLAQAHNVEIETIVADLNDFDMGEQNWDAIVAIFCHLPPTLRQKVHHNIMKALKSGGYYITESYTKQQINYETGGPKDITLLLDLAEVQQQLSDLKWIHACETEREIIEGSGHTGLGSVIQIIAQKPI